MEHIIGGYFLVEGRPRPSWADAAQLPDPFWSLSDCISAIHPHIHLLAWTTRTPGQLADLQGAMGLSEAMLADAMAAVTAAFDAGYLGWPNVWLDPAPARAFYHDHLRHLDQIKLLGIALPEVSHAKAIQAYTPPSTQIGATGVFTLLQRAQRLPEGATLWGYEILGSEAGGDFHSFVCHGFETVYPKRFGLTLNKHGLIAAYAEAAEAAAYTNLDSTGAEPGLWLPWLVFELPLGPDEPPGAERSIVHPDDRDVEASLTLRGGAGRESTGGRR